VVRVARGVGVVGSLGGEMVVGDVVAMVVEVVTGNVVVVGEGVERVGCRG
jgi:hypothetical protein